MDIAALKAAAERATPGEWEARHGDEVWIGKGIGVYIATAAMDEDAEFTALANPTSILSMIARLEALEEAARDAKAKLEPFAQVAHIYRDREPQHGDIIQGWEFSSGSAELRVSHCMDAAKSIAQIDAALEPVQS